MGGEIDAAARVGQRLQEKLALDLQPGPLQYVERPAVQPFHPFIVQGFEKTLQHTFSLPSRVGLGQCGRYSVPWLTTRSVVRNATRCVALPLVAVSSREMPPAAGRRSGGR